MKDTTERLQELLEMKDEEAERLRARIEELESENREQEDRIRFSADGWAAHRTLAKDPHPELSLPRIEIAWLGSDPRECDVECRFVLANLDGSIRYIPLSRSSSRGMDPLSKPWLNGDGSLHLPHFMACRAAHDSSHLTLPVYAITPDGTELLHLDEVYGHQRRIGFLHRRGIQTV